MRGVETMENNDFDILDLELEKELRSLDDNEQYRKIIRAGIAQWLTNLKEGKIKLQTVNDLKVLIETEKILRKK